VRLTLQKVEVDIESFLASQRPLIPPIHDKMAAAKKKKAKALLEKWEKRHAELERWLAKANTWQHFVDFWAVDWAYGESVGEDGKPIFDTDWQSFRLKKSEKEVEPLVLTAQYLYDQPGSYRVAARITDVFGNDGIAAVTVEVR
jgi:hypothetical protein